MFIDPRISNSGLFNVLKKAKIIKEVCEITSYNYLLVPVVTLNMGILRKYDYRGVNNYMDNLYKEEVNN